MYEYDPRSNEMTGLLQLLEVVTNDTEYKKLAQTVLGSSPDFEKRRPLLLDLKSFSKLDFVMLLKHFSPTGVKLPIAAGLLKKLLEHYFVVDNDLGLANQFAPFAWNPNRIAHCLATNILDNALLGRSFIVEKYSPSVVALEVQKEGQLRIGTAFLILNDVHSGVVLVTAKHNVDPNEGVNFLRIANASSGEFVFDAEWQCHKTLDIAVLRVQLRNHIPWLNLSLSFDVLDETISLGYPKVATADQAYLLAHRGELNAEITSYLDHQKYLLVSNSVSPGSSGGPVLNSIGQVIGVIVRAFETEHDGGVSQMNAALPAVAVRDFLTSLGPP